MRSLDAKGVPSDAVVLFDGTEASYRGNWRAMKGGDEEPFRLAAAPLAEAEADFLAHADEATRKRRVLSLRKAFAQMRKTGCLPEEWALVKSVENPK